MAKARRLPSGAYRAQVYSHTDTVDGKKVRRYESFTADTKTEAEYLAAEFARNKSKQKRPDNITVGEAIDRYIASKDAVLSPATIRVYKQLRKTALSDIMGVRLIDLTNEAVQTSVNQYSASKAPKTVRNAYGLLTSALKVHHRNLALDITLPQREKTDLYIPNNGEIAQLLNASRPPLRLAILLAAHLGLRRSEICALEVSDFKDGQVAISKAKVQTPDLGWATKRPKTYSGNRKISVPEHIIAELPKGGPIFDNTPEMLTHMFRNLQVSVFGEQRFRFHDLRHYNASVMLAQNVPNKYAQARLGHATDNMLKNVYQHLFSEKQTEVSDNLNNYFKNAMQHEMQHGKRKV